MLYTVCCVIIIVAGSNTIFKNIYKIRPGTILSVSKGKKYSEKLFWSASKLASKNDLKTKSKPDNTVINEFRTLFRSSVKRSDDI